MDIKRSGSQPPTKGPAEYFTGSVRIDTPFKGETPARTGGAVVTFSLPLPSEQPQDRPALDAIEEVE